MALLCPEFEVRETEDGIELFFVDGAGKTVTINFADGRLTRRLGTLQGGPVGPAETMLEHVAEFRVCRRLPAVSEGPDWSAEHPGRTVAIDLKMRKPGLPERQVDLRTEVYIRNVSKNAFHVADCTL